MMGSCGADNQAAGTFADAKWVCLWRSPCSIYIKCLLGAFVSRFFTRVCFLGGDKLSLGQVRLSQVTSLPSYKAQAARITSP